jgi:PAS domain-containing protein
MELTKYKSQVSATLEHVTVFLRQEQTKLMKLGRTVAEKPRRLREALRARENDLRDLLSASLDPIVVTDVGCRFLAANQKGLDLFGVSESNLRMFNIDAFITIGQMSDFDGNGTRFVGRTERHGQCNIKRLDGSLRIAEYTFVANFVPHRHVCRFVNVRTAKKISHHEGTHDSTNVGAPFGSLAKKNTKAVCISVRASA